MTDLAQLRPHLRQNRLSLAAGLTEFPREILDLADSLEILDLSHNRLTTLPPEFARLHRLRVVFFNYNDFETLPAVLGQCPQLSMISFKGNRLTCFPADALPPQLRWLTLTDNRLEQLPPDLGRLPQLQKLLLAGNRLRSLPDLAACHNLELLRLSANGLEALPEWLWSLPRLAWLAYAGNPLGLPGPVALESIRQRSLPKIDWHDIELGETLGEGASGVIQQGRWTTARGKRATVAVKLFKGDITSDGRPQDELQTCVAAGSNPHLVKLLGRLVNAPEGQEGLVFAWLPPDYTSLGNPPSLSSCTRDTYPAGRVFPLAQLIPIAQGIAAAAAHLHRRGILHGDLYAHNILVNARGKSLLGDFGAACFYDPTDRPRAIAIERIEVRAYGCLLEELLDRCDPEDAFFQAPLLQLLRQLQIECTHPNLEQRPAFSDIHAALGAL